MSVVIDTSAMTAILLGEDDATTYLQALSAHAGDLVMSAATLVETRLVLERKAGLEAVEDLDSLLRRLGVETAPFDAQHAQAAYLGWKRFGKGRHDAALNLGDCYAYGVAKVLGASLLFKGEDFLKTDLSSTL